MNYLMARSAEPSTWRGAVMLLMSFGLTLTPEQGTAIVATGTALAGAIGVFSPDAKK